LSAPADNPPARAARGAAPPVAEFLTRLFPPPRAFDVRVGKEVVLRADANAQFTIVVASGAQLRRAFQPPLERSLAAAVVSGALEVEGDIAAAYGVVMGSSRRAAGSARQVLALIRAWRALPATDGVTSPPPRGGAAPARLSGRLHTADRDRAAVRHHYDLGNDFYALILDRRMVYSCGYFPTADTPLDDAQEMKLDLICRKLRLRSGERMLDVGCGWGGLLLHAAERYGVSGVGITLSAQQHALARQRVREAGLEHRVDIRLADYRSLAGETFDKAASVGMFEHVGEARLPEYFARVLGVLRPGGLFLNHGVSRRAGTRPRTSRREWLTDPLTRLFVGRSDITRAVFPDTELIPLSEVNVMAEHAGWEVRDVEALREHYARTLRHWVARLEARRAEAEAIVGAPTVRAWRLYFAASAHRFDVGILNVNQTLLARPGPDGRVDVPATRADIYR
jgi:cyclopropane-fatty-acyl-phospholipid synthase